MLEANAESSLRAMKIQVCKGLAFCTSNSVIMIWRKNEKSPELQVGPALRTWLVRGHWPLVAMTQGILIVLMVHHGWRTWTHHYIGVPGDPSIYLWFLSWWQWAFRHGQSLVFTQLVTYPWGNNILWDTGVPLVFVPLSWLIHLRLLSLSLAYNVANFGGWWFSAMAAYWSYHRITQRRLGSALGSILTMSSAYFTNQALGHVDLMWVGFSFILFAVVHDYVAHSRSTRWLAWRFGLLSLCLWLTNEEYFVTTQLMVFFGLALWIRWGVRRDRWTWAYVKGLLKGYFAGVALGGLLILPLALVQLHAPGQPFAPFTYVDIFQVNAANLLIPVHTWWHYGMSVSFTGNTMEQDGFLGGIFLVGVIGFGRLTRRDWRPLQATLVAWIITLGWLAMGDFILLSAHFNTHIPSLGVVLAITPVLRNIIFDRLMWGAFWGLGLLVALYFNQLAAVSLKALFVGWLGAVVMSWWPAGYPVSHLTSNAWISQSVRQGRIAPHNVLLVFPFDIVYSFNNNVLYTQMANHFKYRLAEGYLSINDADIRYFKPLVTDWAAIQQAGPDSAIGRYYASQLHHPRKTFEHFLRATHTRFVVLTSMAHEAYMKHWLSTYLGPPSGQSHKTVWWRING